MNTVCYVMDLREAVKFAVKSANAKASTTELAAVKLTAEDGKLTFETNNFITGAKVVIPANTSETGIVAVSAKMLASVIAQFDNKATATFRLEDNTLRVDSEGTYFNLLTFNVADFPVPKFNFDDSVTIRTEAFRNLLRKTIFATADEDEHPVFKGVNFVTKGCQLFGYATNTHQLVQAYEPLKDDRNDPQLNFIVPKKACEIIDKALPVADVETFVTIGVKGNSLSVKFANIAFTTRLIEGDFPPLDKVIEGDRPHEVIFNVSEIKNALRQLSIISKDDQYGTVTLELSPHQINIRANSEFIGYAQKVIEAVTPAEIDLTISFNINYLLGLLDAVDERELHGHFGRNIDPAKFDMKGRPDFVYVVTPVRT